MKILEKLTILTLLAVAVAAGLSQFNRAPTVASGPDTVRIRVVEQSKAVAETTRVSVLKVRTLIDTMPGDTIYIPRVTVETLLVKCERCANQLDSLRLFADSAMQAQDDTIASLRARLASCGRQKPWYAVAGGALGLLSCRG